MVIIVVWQCCCLCFQFWMVDVYFPWLYNITNFGRACSQQTSTRKFDSTSRYFSKHNFFSLNTNPLKIPPINAGITYECCRIWTFTIVVFRCILNSYFLAPVFIIVTSKKFSFCVWSFFFPLCIVLLCFVYLKYWENYEIDVLFLILRGCHQHIFYTSTGLNLLPELLALPYLPNAFVGKLLISQPYFFFYIKHLYARVNITFTITSHISTMICLGIKK